MARLQKSDIKKIIEDVKYPNYEIFVEDGEDGHYELGGYYSEYDPETGNTEKVATARWRILNYTQPSQILRIIFNIIFYSEEQRVYKRFKFRNVTIYAEEKFRCLK